MRPIEQYAFWKHFHCKNIVVNVVPSRSQRNDSNQPNRILWNKFCCCCNLRTPSRLQIGLQVFISSSRLTSAAVFKLRWDKTRVRKKFVRPLQRISSNMSSAAQSDYRESMVFESSSIAEISNIEDSFRRLQLSLKSFSQYVPTKYIHDELEAREHIDLITSNSCGSILFSDIASFTTISERLLPHQLHQVCRLTCNEM